MRNDYFSNWGISQKIDCSVSVLLQAGQTNSSDVSD